MEEEKQNEWLYYYALYHGLAHWAAYVAVLVALTGAGFLLSTVTIQTVAKWRLAVIPIVLLWGGEMYLACRICRLGTFVRGQLGSSGATRRPPPAGVYAHLDTISAVDQLDVLRHPWNLYVVAVAATLVSLWDALLIIGCI